MESLTNRVSLDYLRRQDTTLSLVLDDLFDGVYIVDRERHVVFWNKGAERITGYSREEVLGRFCGDDILNHVDENGMPLCGGACPLSRCLRDGKKLSAKIFPRHRSGRRFPIVTNVAPIRDPDNEIIGAIEIFRDVSTEEDFRKLQEKFNALIQQFVSTTTLRDVLEHAKEGRELNSRNRDVTVMFIDIVGFTRYTERNSPGELVGLLNTFFGAAEQIIRECQGDIDKFIGDAVMAVFIDANDAVRAGKRVIAALDALNRERKKAGKTPIAIRIGMHSGTVVEGPIGGMGRKDLTIIGDVVNTAQRVERLCHRNAVFITEATFARLGAPDGFVFLRPMRVKGKADAIPIYKWAPRGDSGERTR